MVLFFELEDVEDDDEDWEASCDDSFLPSDTSAFK